AGEPPAVEVDVVGGAAQVVGARAGDAQDRGVAEQEVGQAAELQAAGEARGVADVGAQVADGPVVGRRHGEGGRGGDGGGRRQADGGGDTVAQGQDAPAGAAGIGGAEGG